MMDASPSPKSAHEYNTLLRDIEQWDSAADHLVRFDVAHTSDNDEFFVFEDALEELMLAFSRDSTVPLQASLPISSSLLRVSTASTSLAPPSGLVSAESKRAAQEQHVRCVPDHHIVPFYQQTMFAAPLCYMFPSAAECYPLFRAMYCRFWCRMHVISSHPDTALFLAKTFEDLAQSAAPAAFHHATQLGAPPLRLTFPWIFTAFVGYLPVREVLQVWDRIIAYDSLELVPVLAAAIFVYRANMVLKAKAGQDIELIFKEISTLHAIPLLQHFIFST